MISLSCLHELVFELLHEVVVFLRQLLLQVQVLNTMVIDMRVEKVFERLDVQLLHML
jgi:hypothetical protein